MVNKISTKKVFTKKKSKIKKNKRKSKKQKGGNFKKIAFCFLIYDEIVHEDIWNNFFKKVDKSRYKNNKKLKYFEDNKLKNCIETGYGDIRITLAQNLMLKEGLKDINNQLFIFLSGNCIPFKSFEHIYKKLDVRYSYFNVAPDSHCLPRLNYLIDKLETKYFKKASTNCTLNRSHAEEIIKNEKLLYDWFPLSLKGPGIDEHGHIMILNMLNKNRELKTTPDISYSGAIQFVPWANMSDFRKYPNTVHDKAYYNYKVIDKDELNYLIKESKCLFGRKFLKNCSVEGENLINILKREKVIFE